MHPRPGRHPATSPASPPTARTPAPPPPPAPPGLLARTTATASRRPAPAPTGPVSPGAKRRRHFRPDIEGLRAVAVLGVVLYHAHVGILGGGFVGVDVFFVVSGYLITGLLWRELSGSGRVSFAGFYGRRARRLLPASILVVIVTIIAARHWLPPLQTPPVAKDGLASALYVANYRFAFTQTDYLGGTGAPSPFLHFWSLGVEEQFYLVWPLLLVGASLVWRRHRAHRYQRYRWRPHASATGGEPDRLRAATALAAVTVGSFFLSLWLTHANQPWAFFSLPTRAWELGAGGLLALAAPEIKRMPRKAAIAAGWAGLAVTVGSMFAITPTDPFPGTVALAPVVGTLAVLGAGEVTSLASAGPGPVWVLGRRGMRMVGRISYSWYLWHWPFLVLAPYALGHTLALWENLVVAAISGVVAAACFLLVETPARDSSWLATLPRRSLLTGGSLSATGAIACVVVVATLPSVAGHGLAPVAKIYTPVSSAPPASGSSPPTTAADPLVAQAAAITAQVNAEVAASIGTTNVPANLTPSLAGAKSSNSPTFYDGCMDNYLETVVRTCAFGDVSSTTSVVLFGDSHAAMWFPAVGGAANKYGWRLLNLTKATCPPLFVNIYSPVLGRNFTECETWRQNVLARIQQDHPAMVILGVARHYSSVYGFLPYDQQWLSGLSRMVSTIRAMGSKVVVLGPVPKPQVTVYDCLSAHLADATACTEPLATGINEAGVSAERAAVTSAGGVYIDIQPWFCTSTISAFLAPAMSAELAVAFAAASP
ncbi:MAG: acyltransferase family protein [Acidimicrobiales bacterium]